MLNFDKIRKKNICLVGMMGSGKSIIGKELSKYFKIQHLDSDTEIEKNAGKNINLLFKDHGENIFRDLEMEICTKLLKKENCIISLGGGSICNSKIRELIKKYSYSIYLKVNLVTLEKRLKHNSKRPLLKNVNKKQKLEEIYREREKYYNSANLIVDNEDKQKSIKKIIEILKINE